MTSTPTPNIAPYGTWRSPVGVDQALGGGAALRDLRADGDTLYWQASLTDQDGRGSLFRVSPGGQPTELTPAPCDVRTRVMEYGGGCYDVREGVLVAVDDVRRAVIEPGSGRQLTPSTPDVRFGALQVHPRLDLVLAVREDHRAGGEPVTTLVALQLSGDNADFGTVLRQGADFVAGPTLSADDQLAWFEWNHPNMPWDTCAVLRGSLHRGAEGWALSDVVVAESAPDVSAQHPAWNGSDLYYSTDRSGWWNLARQRGDQTSLVLPADADQDVPAWTLAPAPWAVQDSTMVLQQFEDGAPRLALLDLDTGVPTWVGDRPTLAGVDSVAFAGGIPHAIIELTDAASALISIAADASTTTLVGGEPAPWPVTAPQSITFTGPLGEVQAWYYPPTNAGVVAPEGELPPLIVKSHGGPTGSASIAHDPLKDFWTQRGFAIVDVNYSGSAHFGRAYRERLKGTWGVADVDDCVAAVTTLVAAGKADPRRVSITGGSAGGYTTLQSLVNTDVYTAGLSRYGIGDLMAMATDTHKFESRYLDGLIGVLPDDEQVYLDRSPIHHVDALNTPMLIQQGTDDKVVPPNQAEEMAAAVRAKGLPVAVQYFEGEGHGFRQVAHRRAALQAELSFYAQLWGFTPADEVPELQIDNL